MKPAHIALVIGGLVVVWFFMQPQDVPRLMTVTPSKTREAAVCQRYHSEPCTTTNAEVVN